MNREQLVSKMEDAIGFVTGARRAARKCADICEEYAEEQIEETAKNGIVELMESIPQKVAVWMVFKFGRECVKCNADTLELSEEADIEGNRYLIKTVITIEKTTPTNTTINKSKG